MRYVWYKNGHISYTHRVQDNKVLGTHTERGNKKEHTVMAYPHLSNIRPLAPPEAFILCGSSLSFACFPGQHALSSKWRHKMRNGISTSIILYCVVGCLIRRMKGASTVLKAPFILLAPHVTKTLIVGILNPNHVVADTYNTYPIIHHQTSPSHTPLHSL